MAVGQSHLKVLVTAMGHDTYVYGCFGEPSVDENGEVTNGHEIAYTRFGAGVPLRDFWYEIFEATKFDNGLSGNGDSKSFGRLEMKAYSARYRRLRPGCFEHSKVTDWMRRVGTDTSQCQWLADQVDTAMSNIKNFFAQTKPEISSAVALYLKHTEFPLEVTRNIAAFAAEDSAHILVHFA